MASSMHRHGILDMDEGAGLPAGAVHCQWVADGRLHQEAVEHRPVVAVIVEPIDEPLVGPRLAVLRSPDDALMQVGDL